MKTKNIEDVAAEIAERIATQMDGRTVTSHEHYREMLTKELEHALPQLVKEVEAREQKKFFSMDLIASFLDFVPEEHKDIARHAYIEAVSEKIRGQSTTR